jgi:hypothetical protein
MEETGASRTADETPAPARQHTAWDAIEHASKIIFAGLTGMIGLGWAAAIAMIVVQGFGSEAMLVLWIATVIAAAAGAFTAPLVCIILWRADLGRAVPFVYLSSLFAIIPTVAIAGPYTVFVAILMVLLLSGVAARKYRIVDVGECEKCGYSLHGLTEPGCPECGHGRKS